jgi:CMP-N-acetylneuraminic acid synthetase
MAIVAIIPARGGSRGLPGKHLRLLGGRPIIAHTVDAALSADRVDRVIVSTDDPAVARAAGRAGAEVPFRRPAVLAGDDTPTLPVIQHAVDWLEAAGERVEVAVTLQPTSPLRDAAEIDAVLALLERSGAASAVSVTPLALPISVVGWLDSDRLVFAGPPGGDVRRQVAPTAVRITGGVYATRRELLRAGRLLDERPVALAVDAASGIDIDTEADLLRARRALRAAGRRSAS